MARMVDVEVARVKASLAKRITLAADDIDTARDRAKRAFSPEDYAAVAKDIDNGLAVLDALESVWEALYGERPSRLDVANALPSY